MSIGQMGENINLTISQSHASSYRTIDYCRTTGCQDDLPVEFVGEATQLAWC